MWLKIEINRKYKAFLDFSEYRFFGARIKAVGFSTELCSRIAELSIEILMENFKRELTEIFEFEICDYPILKTVLGHFGLSGF